MRNSMTAKEKLFLEKMKHESNQEALAKSASTSFSKHVL